MSNHRIVVNFVSNTLIKASGLETQWQDFLQCSNFCINVSSVNLDFVFIIYTIDRYHIYIYS